MKPKFLNQQERDQLYADIATRIELQRAMAEHTRSVLALELGVHENTIIQIDTGIVDASNCRSLEPEAVQQVHDRRAIWRVLAEQMQGYGLAPLAKKYGIAQNTVGGHIKRFRESQRGNDRRMAA